ncbi:MAG: hypothetical protein M1812_008495, partial [Candelaria pacifica]
MNQHPNPGQPNTASISIQHSSVPHPIPSQIDVQHPQPSSSPSMAAKTALITSGAAAATGGAAIAGIKIKQQENMFAADQAMKAGLRKVHKNCREKPADEYGNTAALYDMRSYGASEEVSIDCLKSSGRLDQKTHYMVDQNNIYSFAATHDDHQVAVENQRKRPAFDSIDQMNATQQKFVRLDNQADKLPEELNADQRAAMKGVTAELKDNITAAAGTVEQAAVTIAKPKTPAKSVIVAENVAKAAEQQVDFSVSQRDAQLNT